jgi:thiol-disulfide isomerase/thioredoxin
MKNYVPESKSIAALKKSDRKLEIEAFFATWCSHCKDYMPRFLRVIQDARNPNISLHLIGVPKNFGAEQGPWQGKSIQSIPAIIVKSDGREVTRLGTQPGAMPERELAGILEALR